MMGTDTLVFAALVQPVIESAAALAILQPMFDPTPRFLEWELHSEPMLDRLLHSRPENQKIGVLTSPLEHKA